MKNLKDYQKPEMMFVELRFETSTCQTLVNSKSVVAGKVDGEGSDEPVEGFDAPVFRDGIWDEE